MSPDVAAGWYPDPQGGGGQRYWDGSAWTEHTQPAAQAAPPPPPPPPGGGGAAVAQAQAISQADAAGYHRGSLEGVPQHGRERIEQNRRGLFTSDLSVNEFLLVKQAGFEPLGLVLGSSIYHIGFQQSRWSQNEEMGVLSQAMYHARELAMTRMEEEADQLGADGIVGVRLEVGRYDWGQHMAEFQAVGTAVLHSGGELHRAPNGRPFTSDLSGQAFWTLLQAGYRPVGMVMGSCVYHVAHQGIRQAFKQMGQNIELENYTQALYDARELAMERMQAEAEAVQASGIVGVNLVERSHGWGSHVIEFFAIGTAIVPTKDDHTIPPPQTVLTLNDA
jgi:uncharacterized protein YbjQ (UPF0145 family)